MVVKVVELSATRCLVVELSSLPPIGMVVGFSETVKLKSIFKLNEQFSRKSQQLNCYDPKRLLKQSEEWRHLGLMPWKKPLAQGFNPGEIK